jgi:uncharacterized protein (DUF885 family)
MPGVFELADRYVTQRAVLDPVGATLLGVTGHEHEMTDYSPEGNEARADYAAATLRELEATEVEVASDRVAANFMKERLTLELEMYEAGETSRALRILGSPVQTIRSVFDLMARSTRDDWATVADRLEAVPTALSGFTRTLADGQQRGISASRRQALSCAEQASTWSGTRKAVPFFEKLVAAAEGDTDLRRRLDRAAAAATDAYATLARYLLSEYAPAAPDVDPVGRDRYELAARAFLGDSIDLLDTYAWGWTELHRIEDEMAVEAAKIVPGGSVADALEVLESDDARAIVGEENLRAWIQNLMDSTIEELDGKHFDIADPIKRVEAMIAPPGGAAAMYYTGPSDDFSRPGRTWYPTLGKTRFPLWGEVSIDYHEGVPGHHLQIGQVRYLAGRLSRFQRHSGVSGHAEGWALYAERLMDELGYLENPDYRLGQLRAQAMRAVRVIVDIGMHLELPVPGDEIFHPGETWNHGLAEEFAHEHSYFPADFMSSEIVRYLGLPGQAISYKVGERAWLEVREEARRRDGASFDLKSFHQKALDLGPLGLAQMREEMARI